MSRLARRVEITKLARVLGIGVAELGFLESVPEREIRTFREAAFDAIVGTDRRLLRRLARLVRWLPSPVGAWLARHRFGPMVTARVASELSARRAARVTLGLPIEFLADVAPHFDPRRARELFRLQPIDRVIATAKELIRRGDHIVLGTFVDVFPDDVVAEVEAAIEDEEALLKAAYFVESRNRLNHLVRLMPRERLRRAVLLALDESHDLMREVASLIVNVSYALKRELGEIAAEQDDAVLERIVRFARDESLWDDVLPTIAVLSENVQRRIVNLPLLAREPELFAQALAEIDEHDLWSVMLPLARLMADPMRTVLARAAAPLPRAAMERAAVAALMGEHWDALLDVVGRMSSEKRAELVDIIGHYAAVDGDLVERVRRQSERYGFDWSAATLVGSTAG